VTLARAVLRTDRRGLLAWSVGLVVLIALYAAVYPSVRGSPAFEDVLAGLPASLRQLFTAGGDLGTGAGYLTTELLSATGPALLVVFAIGHGAAAVAGEEDRGTLALLLAGPRAPRRLLLEKAAALGAELLVLVTVLGAAVAVLGGVVRLGIPVDRVAAAMLHLGLLSAVFGALALLVGAAGGALTVSRAVPAALAVGSYLLNGLAPLVRAPGWVQRLSPFAQYLGHDPLRRGASWSSVVVAVVEVVVLVAVAAALLGRRDLRG
jgi:ABC-2 type transport system permease protein